MRRSIRRRSARALAKKVWKKVTNNKDDKKNIRSISDNDSNDDWLTVSVSCNGSSESDPPFAENDIVIVNRVEKEESSNVMARKLDAVIVENQSVTEVERCDDSSEEKDVSTAVTVQDQLDEPYVDIDQLKDEPFELVDENGTAVSNDQDNSAKQLLFVDSNTDSDTPIDREESTSPQSSVNAQEQLEVSTNVVNFQSKEDGKTQSEDSFDLLADYNMHSAPEESATTTSRLQDNGDEACLENKEEFVAGTTVLIIKGAYKGEHGIISRVTSKSAFISIDGMDRDIRKTKSKAFLVIAGQRESQVQADCDKALTLESQDTFLPGNLVRIKKGTHKNCHGVISRVTDKSAFVTIRSLSRDVRKKKSEEFLEVLNDVPQQIIVEQECAKSEYTAGVKVKIVKGTHMGKCGTISRVTGKSVFIVFEGIGKEVRKTNSDKFLQLVNEVE